MGCNNSILADPNPPKTRKNHEILKRLRNPLVVEVPITRQALNDDRKAFWQKSHHGDRSIWEKLQGAADAVLRGDLELANAVLDASHISSLDGSLAKCQDQSGRIYEVPEMCYNNPVSFDEEPTDDPPETTAGGTKLRLRLQEHTHEVTLPAKKTVLDAKLELSKLLVEKRGSAPAAKRQRWLYMGKEMDDVTVVTQAAFEGTIVVAIRPAYYVAAHLKYR